MVMNPVDAVLWSMVLFGAGAIVTAMAAGRLRIDGLAFAFVLVASVLAGYAGVSVLLHGPSEAVTLLAIADLGADLSIAVDELSALFLIVVAAIAVLTSMFGIRFLEADGKAGALGYYPLLLLFFGGVIGVICSGDMLFFLVFWEVMTLASYLLVVYYRDDRVVLRAGLKYFIITHVATGCLMAGVIVLYVHGGRSFSFGAMHDGAAYLAVYAPWLLHLVLGLLFVAFATKAGIFPFGDWLPDAYPAAPAPATAAFAGTMTKLGIYGLVRVFFQFLPESGICLTWGLVLSLFAAASIALGTLVALAQDDTKRLLAFSTVGQMGYILLGVGLAVYFRPLAPALALTAAVGGLFHLVNHVCYKSCLFLNAGAVEYRTGVRNLNLIGGLAAVMPITCVSALFASLAIAGLPPFGGFASKWVLYHAAVMGGQVAPFTLVLGLVAMFVSIATLALFLKFIAAAFLGHVRHPEGISEPREVPLSMTVPQVVLAGLCLLFGLAPMLAVRSVHAGVAASLGGWYTAALPMVFGTDSSGIVLNTGAGPEGAWIAWPILIALAAAGMAGYLIYRAGGAELFTAPVWHCGEEHTEEETAYQAHSLYRQFKDVLQVQVGAHRTRGLYPRIPRLTVPNFDRLRAVLDLDRWAYYPAIGWGSRLVERVASTHIGIVQFYVLWMVLGAVAAVSVLFWLARV